MRKLFLPAILFVAAVLAGVTVPASAKRVAIVAASRAGQSQGNLAAVRGRADIHADPIFQGTDVDLVDADGHVVFIGFIPKLNAYAFPQTTALNGKTVVMYGIIEFYRGRPATQLIYSDQLRGT